MIQKTQSIFLNHSLNKLRNISRQVNFKYIILSCNLPFCRCKNFGVKRKKKKKGLMGEGTDPRPFPLGVRTVTLRESRTIAEEGVI